MATTTSELTDMAMVAISGVTSPNSASGTASRLYAIEKAKFSCTIRIVLRATRTASATGISFSPMNTASAACWLASDALLLPATVTAKYHFDLGGVKPYIGGGAAYFMWLSDKPGAATLPLGVTDTDLSDEFGVVLQTGFDVPLGDQGFGLTFDAKHYFIDTTASWFVGNTLAIETEHKLDPWVLSAGVAYRF